MISLQGLEVERLNNEQPILSAVKEHPWENEVVFNPACVLLEDRAEIGRVINALHLAPDLEKSMMVHDSVCVLIYRAQGAFTEADDYRRSRLGFALLSPTLQLLYRHPEPIIVPENDYESRGVEDPRIMRVDDKYLMFYTGYCSVGKSQNESMSDGKTNVCFAVSNDLVNWEKKGILKGNLNDVNNKDTVLFPKKIFGKYCLLHRPAEGIDPLTIHIAYSDSVFGEWIDHGTVMSVIDVRNFTKSWIGAGAPPLQIGENKFLILYHTGHNKADGGKEYDLGICTATFDNDRNFFITERIEPLMKPRTRGEIEGNKSLGVNNVVFVCGAYFYDNYLYFPYAGADTVILGGRIKIDP